jgi:hypothetical protein
MKFSQGKEVSILDFVVVIKIWQLDYFYDVHWSYDQVSIWNISKSFVILWKTLQPQLPKINDG